MLLFGFSEKKSLLLPIFTATGTSPFSLWFGSSAHAFARPVLFYRRILVDIVWTVHIFAHLFAVGSAFGLLSQMGVCLPRPAKYGFFALVLTVVGIIVGMKSYATVSRDALIYHLAVPKWWLEQGRIFERVSAIMVSLSAATEYLLHGFSCAWV